METKANCDYDRTAQRVQELVSDCRILLAKDITGVEPSNYTQARNIRITTREPAGDDGGGRHVETIRSLIDRYGFSASVDTHVVGGTVMYEIDIDGEKPAYEEPVDSGQDRKLIRSMVEINELSDSIARFIAKHSETCDDLIRTCRENGWSDLVAYDFKDAVVKLGVVLASLHLWGEELGLSNKDRHAIIDAEGR